MVIHKVNRIYRLPHLENIKKIGVRTWYPDVIVVHDCTHRRFGSHISS